MKSSIAWIWSSMLSLIVWPRSVLWPASVSSRTAPAISAARIAISSRIPSVRATLLPAERCWRAAAGVTAGRGAGCAGAAARNRLGATGVDRVGLHPPGRRGRRARGEHVRRQLVRGRRRLLAARARPRAPARARGPRSSGPRPRPRATAGPRRERLGHVRVVGGRRQRALVLAPDRELGEGRALPRQAAGEQLVEDDAERVDVGGGRRLLAARLLGRQVGGRADHRADLGQARLRASPGRSRSR